MFKKLHTLLTEGRDLNHPVCHDDERTVSWQEFAGRVGRLASGFAARPEQRWLVVAGRPLAFITQLMALLHAGKSVVIPPNTQPGTLTQLARSFDAIADETIIGELEPPKPLHPHTAIIDLFTSGSTGEPKRIRKTLAQFEIEIETLEGLWGTTLGSASIVSTAPHLHFYGLLFRLLWPMAAGRTFDNITCAHPDTLTERLARLGNCALVSSPAQLSRLPELVSLGSLQPKPRIIFSSGGPLSSTTAADFLRQMGSTPTEVFGSTETGGIAWRRQETDDLWTPFPGMCVSADVDGALLLRSPFLATDPDLKDKPWRMDDAVVLQPDKRFRLAGRLDRTVKIEEKRLSLPELEDCLAEHPWVSAAAAVALGGRRQHVGAVLTLSAEGRAKLAAHGRRCTAQEFRRHLAMRFEDILLPRRWRFPDQLPVNERGKLTQTALAALFTDTAKEDERTAA